MRHTTIIVAIYLAVSPFKAFGEEAAQEEERRDCDDSNSEVNPDAEEVCDGIDNNCNGAVDEGFVNTDGDDDANCVDNDDDNDGEPDESDCDPLDPRRFPLNNEGCDGIDNDCDGEIDEGCPDRDRDGIADAIDDDNDNDRSSSVNRCYSRRDTPVVYIFGYYGGYRWLRVLRWCPFERGVHQIDPMPRDWVLPYGDSRYGNRVIYGRPPGAPSYVTRFIERRVALDARSVPNIWSLSRDRAIRRASRGR